MRIFISFVLFLIDTDDKSSDKRGLTVFIAIVFCQPKTIKVLKNTKTGLNKLAEQSEPNDSGSNER